MQGSGFLSIIALIGVSGILVFMHYLGDLMTAGGDVGIKDLFPAHLNAAPL
ncbi:hypothetical protein [Arthrobacter sp. ISL-28]|uniref:hypothetical protein n=1 Tax=Arthrobacter sp. ISL-28 TaxID=2819108 RepID=UPI001BECD9F4|nr:hypothetical protein [Arthrobacter sp. ISL-28]MBT2519749.1 hypothetical protein [Arthrobacter sp. ISL-28]